MAIENTAYTVTTTPVMLGVAIGERREKLIVVVDSGTVYLGGDDVTTASGLPVTAADSPFVIERGYWEDRVPSQPWHAVSAGSVAARAIEVTG